MVDNMPEEIPDIYDYEKALDRIIDVLGNQITEQNNVLGTGISASYTSIVNNLTEKTNYVISWLDYIQKNLIAKADSIGLSLEDDLNEIYTSLFNQAWNLHTSLKSTVSTVGNSVTNNLRNSLNQVESGLKTAMDSLSKKVSGQLANVDEWISNSSKEVTGFIDGVLGNLGDVLTSLYNRFAALILDGINAIVKIGDFFDNPLDSLSGIIDISIDDILSSFVTYSKKLAVFDVK